MARAHQLAKDTEIRAHYAVDSLLFKQYSLFDVVDYMVREGIIIKTSKGDFWYNDEGQPLQESQESIDEILGIVSAVDGSYLAEDMAKISEFKSGGLFYTMLLDREPLQGDYLVATTNSQIRLCEILAIEKPIPES